MSVAVSEPVREVSRKWKPYPSYKDSGIEWLGRIPAHWETMPLKYACVVNPDVLDERTSPDYELDYIDIGNVDSEGRISCAQQMKFEDAPSRARRRVSHGDIIVSTVRTYLRAVAYMDNPKDNVIVSTGFAVLRPASETDSRFLYYLVRSTQFIETVVARSKGVGYPAINPSDLARIWVWLPPLAEQHAIAAFLDRETAKIDTLISAKERQIELLREKRMVIISQAVTRGLDPNAPLKDSGIEWLGKIPAHWGTMPLKRAVECPVERGVGQELPFVALEHIVGGEGRLVPGFEWETADASDCATFRPGDVLYGKLRPYLRKYLQVDRDGCCPTELLVLRPATDDFLNRFLYYLVQSQPFVALTEATSYGVKMPRTAWEDLSPCWVWLPPLAEQHAIAAFLDRETAKIDALISRIQEHIERLREYRIALISAAVTGQIDVREQVVVQQPVVVVAGKPGQSRTANKFFKRQVLAAEIVSRHQDTPRFGRVKLQKTLVLAEYHLGLEDIESQPLRAAAGPFDNRMMRSIDKQLEKQKWYKPVKVEGSGWTYERMSRCGEHRKYFDRYWGDKREEFDRLIELVKPLKTEETEIIATLYMAWNDFLISGQSFDDAMLINEVLNNWDPAKKRYQPRTWQHWLDWMRNNGLVPRGYGKLTGRRQGRR